MGTATGKKVISQNHLHVQKLIGYVGSSCRKGERGEKDSGCSIQGHACAKDGAMPYCETAEFLL